MKIDIRTPYAFDAAHLWRDVRECLPEPRHMVLLAEDCGDFVTVSAGNRDTDGRWHASGRECVVTHWMQLPAPPGAPSAHRAIALDEVLRDALLTLIEGAEEGLYWNAQNFYTRKHQAWREEVEKAIKVVRVLLQGSHQ